MIRGNGLGEVAGQFLLDKVDGELFQKVVSGRQEQESALIRELWEKIRSLASQNAGFRNWGIPIAKAFNSSSEEKARIIGIFQEVVVGLQTETTKISEEALFPKQEERSPLQNAFYQLLFTGLSLSRLPESLRSLLFTKDPQKMKEARDELQRIFKAVAAQLNGPPSKVTEVLIGQLTAFYPFFNPGDGETIEIPHWNGESWRLISFKVERINLTVDADTRLTTPHYAYGLIPQESEGASIQILFCGTAPPAVDGSFHGYLADTTPGTSVGHPLFEKGKEQISSWISKNQRIGQKIILTGASLGGALAILFHSANRETTRFIAFAPPGQLKRPDSEPSEGEIIYHSDDPVFLLGWHPTSEKVTCLTVLTPEERGRWDAHSTGYLFGKAILAKVNLQEENRRMIRIFLTLLQQIVALPIFVTLISVILLYRFSLFVIEKVSHLRSLQKEPAQK